ncbi:MAG: flagellar hook-associated family protein [Rhizobiaceae bacterium]
MTFSVSTNSFTVSLQRAVNSLQKEIAKHQSELQTGMLADAGLSLGATVSSLVLYKQESDRLASILDTNALVETRLEATQSTLAAVTSGLDTLVDSLVAGTETSASKALIKDIAGNALSGFVTALNATVNGQFLFAGVNAGTAPFGTAAIATAKAQMDSAFLTHFGFPKTDPAAASITAAAFDTFLTTQIEPMFAAPAWNATISTASDTAIKSRISLTQVESTSLSANEDAFRHAFFAAAVTANFIDAPFSQQVAQSIARLGTERSYQAKQLVGDLGASTGLLQNRISKISFSLTKQADLFEKSATELVGVDPYETTVRMNSILNTLESTIVVSRRIQEVSFTRLTR